jgi:outer membrane immunogenic protein
MDKARTQLLAIATVLALSSTAYAADMGLPPKALVSAPPPPFSWTGFYLGIAGGAGWGTIESQANSATFITPLFTFFDSLNAPLAQDQVNGWLFGGTVGYNWQAYPWLVLGIEGDWDLTDFKGTTPCGPVSNFLIGGGGGAPLGGGPWNGCSAQVKWTADLTGRVGFAVDRALLYAKGGVVWADTNYSIFQNSFVVGGAGPQNVPSSTSLTNTRVGALLGVGVEYAFLPNWSAKIEYNLMDFGTQNETFNIVFPTCGPASTCTANVGIRQVISTVKVGVNYRFTWGQ